jgi:threonine dehydratase
MVTLEDIKRAQQRLRGVAVRTPLIAYFPPAQKADANPGDDAARGQLWLKPESLQPIGSFKLRGAYNKIASLTDEERSAASSRTPAAITRKAWLTLRARWA